MHRKLAALFLLSASCLAAEPGRKWDFEADTTGSPAKGFHTEVGKWTVVRDGTNQVLAQQAQNEDAVFNVALIEIPERTDLDLSVKLRAIEGKEDQGGGLVWRARDVKNYYIARYNPLENNIRVYKVLDGKRTMFQSADVPGNLLWHTLRVTMTGTRMTCYLDGTKYLEADDATFPTAGRIGVWTKADAQTQFDDLTLAE